MDYSDFIVRKSHSAPAVGFSPPQLAPHLFDFQRDIVAWALRKGRAAIFADCGMGKTPMQLEWASRVAEHSGGRVLILAPLAVSQQTIAEGAKFGTEVHYAHNADEMGDARIVVTNYERLDRFRPEDFAGVVLDESSILKAFDGKTRTEIIQSFSATPYRLACTATPAPNDFMELGNHAEFLGVMTRPEMLSMYFVHDGGSTQDWRIKGHAEDAFWRWVCSWAVMLRRPSDLGYDDDGFVLPALNIEEHVVPVNHAEAHAAGTLFKMEAVTLDEQRAARRATIEARVAKCAGIVAATDRPFLVWCELNAEGDALEKAIPGAVQVAGSDDADFKVAAVEWFVGSLCLCQSKYRSRVGVAGGAECTCGHRAGKRVLISKPSMFGMGLNLQVCADMAFVGLSHSYEQWYQAVRRCWRFGQTREVTAHAIIAETEGRVAANLRRKEADAARMAESMVAHMRDIQNAEVRATSRMFSDYRATDRLRVPRWLVEYAAMEAA